MDPWKDGTEILTLVRDKKNWTPELFERCKSSTLVGPCIFNQIRKVLTPEQYQAFDDAYCFYLRPDQKGVVDYIRKIQKEGNGEEWKSREVELLNRKRWLLKQKLQTLTGN